MRRIWSARFDPWTLVALVAATRVPFFSRTLYEFDSVNYAVALFRFDLTQDTPHLPGSLLHVGIARGLYALLGNANTAYVLESFLLSIASVLCVWLAVRTIGSRRTAFVGAVVWSFNPLFWFYGCVATAYVHEAFFTSAVAALALRYCADAARQRDRFAYPIALAATAAIAGAARQTSLMFLAPAVIVALAVVRAPGRIWLASIAVGAIITASWFGILIALAGGFDRYAALAPSVSIVRQYSIFLDGTLTRHLDMIGKLSVFLAVSSAPLWTLALWYAITRRAALWSVAVRALRTNGGRVLVVLAAVPLLFYTAIFYAKPGYLLNVLSVCAIVAVVFAERVGGWDAVRRWGVRWSIVGIALFLAPIPESMIDMMRQFDARGAAVSETAERHPTLNDRLHAAVVKLFAEASWSGIRTADESHESLLAALQALPSTEERQVVLATHSGQWVFFYRPKSMVYDIPRYRDQHEQVFAGHAMVKRVVEDSVIQISPAVQDVVVLLWHEHWAFPDVARQVNLEPLSVLPNLDAWRITDEHFQLKIGGVVVTR